ncbi:MAG: hypothetical protein ACXVP0_08240 [Bacteroidia bacterium]
MASPPSVPKEIDTILFFKDLQENHCCAGLVKAQMYQNRFLFLQMKAGIVTGYFFPAGFAGTGLYIDRRAVFSA